MGSSALLPGPRPGRASIAVKRAAVRAATRATSSCRRRFNVHLHSLALDGGFTRGADGALVFHELQGLRQDDVARVAARTAARVTAMLARRGLGPGSQADEPTDEPDLLTTLHAASVTERVALGPKAGWRITHVGAGGEYTAAVRVPPSAASMGGTTPERLRPGYSPL